MAIGSNSATPFDVATEWREITPANEDLADRPEALWIDEAGDVVLQDASGNTLTFTVLAGGILPLKPKQVRTGTTATVYGLY